MPNETQFTTFYLHNYSVFATKMSEFAYWERRKSEESDFMY